MAFIDVLQRIGSILVGILVITMNNCVAFV